MGSWLKVDIVACGRQREGLKMSLKKWRVPERLRVDIGACHWLVSPEKW